MKKRGPGRPARTAATTTPDAILDAALDILDRNGADALTMRELGARLGVNPMTIYHHFGDRDGLIKSIAEQVYASVLVPKAGDVRRRIKGLMIAYHRQVVQHPGLTLSIFGSAKAFPDEAQRISDDLIQLLRAFGLTSQKARHWMHILVDVTHGAGIATAMNQPGASTGKTSASANADYARALSTLLDAIASAEQEKASRKSKRPRSG